MGPKELDERAEFFLARNGKSLQAQMLSERCAELYS